MSSVLFDGRYINDRYHGIGRYAFHLLLELAQALPSASFTVLRDPVLPDTRFAWEELTALNNVALRDVSAPPFSAREQAVVSREAARSRARLYHTPYFALPWAIPRPSVVTVHDCIFEHDPRYMPRRWGRAYYRLLMNASLRRARFVVVPSRATAADLRHFYGLDSRKIVVTPEAAGGTFRPISDEGALEGARRRYGLDKPFVLAVGARRPHKNFGILARAFAELHAPNAELVFVGEADARFPDDSSLTAGVAQGRVRFLGKVPEDDLPLLYNLATLFASPSLIEGFGLPVLEAMSCGTPVICSDIPVFREVTADAALLVEPKQTSAWAAAIARALQDEDMRPGLRDAGLRRAATF
ncbi:MAG TPA: glycosyltransferase family 1 protein, partial [Chloroflexia bacterium]|nr:glycosyltransferase family 1 protein [Chloroflexia bacterium]